MALSLFFLCFCVFVVDLLLYVLSQICCGVFYHQLIVAGSCILVLSTINFFVGFRIGNHQIKSYSTICYRSEVLGILGIFGLSNV